MKDTSIVRRPKTNISSLGVISVHLRNPWVIAWWSLCYPGFGHLACGVLSKGIFVFAGELLINYMAKINLAILYSFTGKFDLAKEVLDTKWLLVYCAILIYAIWDSYRVAVEANKLSILADREHATITPAKIGSLSINTMVMRVPWVSAAWSLLLPGLGQLYNVQAIKAFFLLLSGGGFLILSNALAAFHYTALGDFQQAKAVIDWQWFLNIPSFYIFAIWESHTDTVELNKLFKTEQAQNFKAQFQSRFFNYPVNGG